jgi:hypothetical protein
MKVTVVANTLHITVLVGGGMWLRKFLQAGCNWMLLRQLERNLARRLGSNCRVSYLTLP